MKYYAEFETDKYVRETFFSDFSYKGVMAEVGAGPPEFLSMSKHFRDNGWRTICVDPNPKFVAAHRNQGNEIYQYACADKNSEESEFFIVTGEWPQESNGVSFSSLGIRYDNPFPGVDKIKVSVRTLDSILEELELESIDYLSVDVEGWEMEVVKGFNLSKYKPKVVVLENLNYDEKYVEIMRENGYNLINKLFYNYIFAESSWTQ